jgi:DNA repair protein RadA/Sms
VVKNIYVCQSCGAEHRKWQGQCPDCGQWNTISEQQVEPAAATAGKAKALHVTSITDVDMADSPRRSTAIDELDRVLGGGLVPGSAVLLGGDPGIGKSTLLLQACCRLAEQGPVLYVTGEESVGQVRMRGERIRALHEDVHLVAATDLDSVLKTIGKIRPDTVVVDSIQTMNTARLTSAPGTVAQVRDCAAALIRDAKQRGHAMVLIGHVTKDGAIAGPAYWNIWWMPCCILRAIRVIPTASCAR